MEGEKVFEQIKKKIATGKFGAFFVETSKYGNLIPNINLDLSHQQKKILLVYLDMFEASKQVASSYLKNESGAMHTNRFEMFQMIKSLIDLDFCIDVCGNDDLRVIEYIKTQDYDIIIGLGEVFRWATENVDAYKIIYMTENPYIISQKKEQERIDYFKIRYHKEFPLSRTGMFFKKDDEEKADGIICLGDEKFYQNIKIPKVRIFPSALYNDNFSILNVKRKKNNFMVFGTDGFIHKGIDLLIDVFNKHSDLNLYICGDNVTNNINKIMNVSIMSNINDCGYINIKSPNFLELVNECSFIILPSCSEATSTAVLTGMRHGLIPIVTHDLGFDTMEDYCFFFEGYELGQIEDTIQRVMNINEDELTNMSRQIYEFANKEFCIKEFGKRFTKAMQMLINFDY